MHDPLEVLLIRSTAAIVGTATPYTGSTTSTQTTIGGLDAANQAQAVVLTSKAYGQNGGNDISAANIWPGPVTSVDSVASGDTIGFAGRLDAGACPRPSDF